MMGVVVFSLPQRQMARVTMPEFCFVHSAYETLLKIALLETEDVGEALYWQLREEIESNAQRYLRAPGWGELALKLRNSEGADRHCARTCPDNQTMTI